MKKLILLLFIPLVFTCSSDSSDDSSYINNNELINCEGNPVPTMVYGTQEWTVENACHTTYRDGTPIPQVQDISEWNNLTTGAWRYVNNDPQFGSELFLDAIVYNFYAVTDPRGFSPEGWHVPTDDDWSTLENFLISNGYNYDNSPSQNKLGKAIASTTGWFSSTNDGAVGNDQSINNSSGFNAFPVGIGSSETYVGSTTFFWTRTGASGPNARTRSIGCSDR